MHWKAKGGIRFGVVFGQGIIYVFCFGFFFGFFQTMFFLLLVWKTSGRFSTGVLVLFKVSEVAQ